MDVNLPVSSDCLAGTSKVGGVGRREETQSKTVSGRLGSPVEAEERAVYEHILGEDAFALRVHP